MWILIDFLTIWLGVAGHVFLTATIPPTQSCEIVFFLFGNLHFCCKPCTTHPAESLFAQPSLEPSFAIPRLGCSWHVCMCVCVSARMCSWKENTKQYYDEISNGPHPFIQLLETRMILTINTKLGRTKRSCWRITTGRWWKGIAKILKKEMTMSPRHSPHSPPRTFRRLGFFDVDDHLSDIVLALVQVKPEVVSQKEIWYYQLIMAKKVWNLIWCDTPLVQKDQLSWQAGQ